MDAEAIAQPEGLIDPWLKTVSFWNDNRKLAGLHYYATHPMSYYGDGLVTSDFVGLAREACTKEDVAPHLYFTGCAGNIAAGKYNDGDRANRFLLAERIYRAMQASEEKSEHAPVGDLAWRMREVVLPPRSDQGEAELVRTLSDAAKPHAVRSRAAMKMSYLRRAMAKTPIALASLHLGKHVCLLHLPAESFVEYQLFAQATKARWLRRHGGLWRRRPVVHPHGESVPGGGVRAERGVC